MNTNSKSKRSIQKRAWITLGILLCALVFIGATVFLVGKFQDRTVAAEIEPMADASKSESIPMKAMVEVPKVEPKAEPAKVVEVEASKAEESKEVSVVEASKAEEPKEVSVVEPQAEPAKVNAEIPGISDLHAAVAAFGFAVPSDGSWLNNVELARQGIDSTRLASEADQVVQGPTAERSLPAGEAYVIFSPHVTVLADGKEIVSFVKTQNNALEESITLVVNDTANEVALTFNNVPLPGMSLMRFRIADFTVEKPFNLEIYARWPMINDDGQCGDLTCSQTFTRLVSVSKGMVFEYPLTPEVGQLYREPKAVVYINNLDMAVSANWFKGYSLEMSKTDQIGVSLFGMSDTGGVAAITGITVNKPRVFHLLGETTFGVTGAADVVITPEKGALNYVMLVNAGTGTVPVNVMSQDGLDAGFEYAWNQVPQLEYAFPYIRSSKLCPEVDCTQLTKVVLYIITYDPVAGLSMKVEEYK